jgi:hypothetical protein
MATTLLASKITISPNLTDPFDRASAADFILSIFNREMGVTLHNAKVGSKRDEGGVHAVGSSRSTTRNPRTNSSFLRQPGLAPVINEAFPSSDRSGIVARSVGANSGDAESRVQRQSRPNLRVRLRESL